MIVLIQAEAFDNGVMTWGEEVRLCAHLGEHGLQSGQSLDEKSLGQSKCKTTWIFIIYLGVF